MPACYNNRAESSMPTISVMEQSLLDHGLIDIQTIDPTIAVQLVYSTFHNFARQQLYPFNKAYLLEITAQKLKLAHQYLYEERKDLHFVIYDAFRPLSAQKAFWELVEGTDKEDYVAEPSKLKSMHTYGLAVDLSIADCTGQPLPMGSEFDFFGDRTRVDIEVDLLTSGKITQREYENRQLLRHVMTKAGFFVYVPEWWHFNAVDPDFAAEKYSIIQVKQ